ncbi:hypothetical protein [Goodfellowiella coeruleoviolacea]|uniref:hypothetical protein n=1 Tax=Goodfellowiella coeruleoviolacea TaxID=334858 RepID=UPI0020A5B269|nr:hypothetical protein [Goodfellowiella coeruleoviolacea]
MYLNETDVVTRLHIYLRANDLHKAIQACQPLAARLKAMRFEAGPANSDADNEYLIRLIIRTPARSGESPQQALRRVTEQHAGILGADNQFVQISPVGSAYVSRLLMMGAEWAGVILPGCYSCELLAEQGRDPFNSEPAAHEVEDLDDIEAPNLNEEQK